MLEQLADNLMVAVVIVMGQVFLAQGLVVQNLIVLAAEGQIPTQVN